MPPKLDLPQRAIKRSYPSPNVNNNFTHKRTKLYNSRQIRTELTDPSFTNPNITNKNANVINRDNVANKLDVESFLTSRKFEINEFEQSQLRSRHSSSTRVFQSLPREMRRRTASHNVRRIPKRLRTKALREMGLTNQLKESGKETKGVDPKGKPVKSKQPRGRELYHLKRQSKLLKYAGKHKLSGHLITGELINVKNMNMRNKLKIMQQRILEIQTTKPEKLPETIRKGSIAEREYRQQKQFTFKMNNTVGSYDNTGINCKGGIGKVTSLRYSNRQTKFKWLPTHVWHAKRAKMVKLWGWNLVNAPTMKCFRRTSRQSRLKGCVAFDTSYINTIVLNSHYTANSKSNSALIDIVSKLTNGSATKKKWFKRGRAWEGLINIGDEVLGKSTIVWFDDLISQVQKCVIRIHPSTYDVIMDHLLKEVTQFPSIILHDCRYSIGSIHLTGPKSLLALSSILHPCNRGELEDESYQLWRNFSRLNDLTTIPTGSFFSFDVADPRFWNKPVTPGSVKDNNADKILDCIIEIKNGNGVDSECLNNLITPSGRQSSYTAQRSLKTLGKLMALPSATKSPLISSGTPIPVTILKLQDGYQLLVPWFWMTPFWYKLVHVPHLSVGGLKQMNQLSFEKGGLGFGDYVFTRAGFAENQIKMDELAKKWNKRPKSKRVHYDKLKIGHEIGEVGSPFGCDWRYLQVLRLGLNKVPAVEREVEAVFDERFERVINCKKDVFEAVKDVKKADEEQIAFGKPLYPKLPIKLQPKSLKTIPSVTRDELKLTSKDIPQLPVVPISFVCLNKGHPRDSARIYRIPRSHHAAWLEYARSQKKSITGKNKSTALPCPSRENLIGFVTSATFNLTSGCGTGVGFVDAEVARADTKNNAFIIRNSGSDKCFVAEWSEISVDI